MLGGRDLSTRCFLRCHSSSAVIGTSSADDEECGAVSSGDDVGRARLMGWLGVFATFGLARATGGAVRDCSILGSELEDASSCCRCCTAERTPMAFRGKACVCGFVGAVVVFAGAEALR